MSNTEKSIDTKIVDFIMELDWLTTKEFCDKYEVPPPKPRHTVELTVGDILRIDAVKLKLITEYAKKLRKGN